MTCPDDYNVVLMQFTGDILSAVRLDNNGYPTIYINDALSAPAKQEALLHELSHFEHDDIYNHLTIYDVEKRAIRESKVQMLTSSDGRMTAREDINLAYVGDRLHEEVFFTNNNHVWIPFASAFYE